jgi:hypothetical protein
LIFLEVVAFYLLPSFSKKNPGENIIMVHHSLDNNSGREYNGPQESLEKKDEGRLELALLHPRTVSCSSFVVSKRIRVI